MKDTRLFPVTVALSQSGNINAEAVKHLVKCLLCLIHIHKYADSVIVAERIACHSLMILPIIQPQLVLLHNTEHPRLYLHLDPALTAVIQTEHPPILLQFKFRITFLHMDIREADHHTGHHLIYSHHTLTRGII